MLGLFAAGRARADTNFVTAQLQPCTNRYEAYAQVEPIAALPVRAAEDGVVKGLKLLPGTRVQAGQKLAELGGPQIQAMLAQSQAGVSSASTNLVAARASLDIQRRQLASHLVTRRRVLEAETAAARAESDLEAAEARLRARQQTIEMKAPVGGTVLAVNAAEGEQVMTGDVILTLQPTHQLWLKADYYGTDAAAIRAGMTGQFHPAGRGKPVPVRVLTVFGALSPAGSESVGLRAVGSKPPWLNGEFGTVTLNGAGRSLVAVPTRALILDRGRWWVLVHTPGGNRPQAVVPGPVRGWQTFIKSGLQPGTEVVVENAYLEFHRGISKTYQPPD